MGYYILPLAFGFSVTVINSDNYFNDLDEIVRICMYETLGGVYCERIMGTISNTERIIETFYHLPDWYQAFKYQHDNNWISDYDYIRNLEFGFDQELFVFNQLNYDYELYEKKLPTKYTDYSSYRQFIYMEDWNQIKNSIDFEMNWRMAR